MNDTAHDFHSSPSFNNSKQVKVIVLAMLVFKLIGSLERTINMLVSGPARTNTLQLVSCGNILLSLTENAIFICNLLLQYVSTTCEGRRNLYKSSYCSELPCQFSVLLLSWLKEKYTQQKRNRQKNGEKIASWRREGFE